VTIFTDGACSGNPGPGGWGALLRYKHREKAISGAENFTTNNRMELTAALEALRLLKKPATIILYTDSEYLRRGITEWLPKWIKAGWKTSNKLPVKNQDLWQALYDISLTHSIAWKWIKGHSNHPENDYVDKLAREAINNRK